MGHPVFSSETDRERGREAKEKGKLEGFLNAMTITVYHACIKPECPKDILNFLFYLSFFF